VSGFEIIEHTADVGIEARADSLGELFRQAALGLSEIAGIWNPQPAGEEREAAIDLEAADLGALLVDWLAELLYLHESRGAAISSLILTATADPVRLLGKVGLSDLAAERAGTQVKAATYHGLTVERDDRGWHARVYLDV
jgi:SHS2 domain-containing protein